MNAAAFSQEERLARLALIRSENVGPVTFNALVERFGNASAALEALPDLAARGGSARRIKVADLDDAQAEMARAERLGARFLFRGELEYPAILASEDSAAPVLSVMGDPALLDRPALAVVGSRNASTAGMKMARTLAMEAGEAGYAIVSGLARGIDTAGHEAGLSTGTTGVFAGGLDKPYPPENKPLMRRIVDGGGCLVTEMPFGWTPRAVDFPRRNRVVVALSLGVLVVEAALRSGSLISARMAGELGRLVFAVPGSPVDPRAAGTNRLIKDGAILVTEAADVIDALRPLDSRMSGVARPALREPGPEASAPQGPADASERGAIISALGPVPVTLDDLVAHLGLSPGAVQLVLLELDLAGRLERHPGGAVSLPDGV
ncbi:DNA-processing protein DprA [Aureimonas mangrovi]|uniref:DNA-processing protein DprA n=1 Tax=Aureimonas mangrovi TaxID=2758041 RepID=UPI00163D67C8|nr:DNA-processing protein DprA [Aureimonas mangrovi]